jgi:hypothetical protein
MLNTEYNDVFNELQNYMLNNENIKKSLEHKIVLSRGKEVSKEVGKEVGIFIPTEKDTLLWCYYIIVNGEIKYETLNHKNVLVEKQLKIDFVSLVRKNKDLLKTIGKFDTITNIENNLAHDNIMNIKTFLSLCAISNLNIIYINKKTYFEVLMNDSPIIYVINQVLSHSKYFNKYGFQLANDEILSNIKKTLYKVDKIDKPIKAISGYKVEELVNICTKLAIETTHKDTGKNKSKKDLYESIVQYF